MLTLSPSRLSAGTCDLCGNGPVAVVHFGVDELCEHCLRAGIAAIEAKKEPMTTQDPADVLRACPFCGAKFLAPTIVAGDKPDSLRAGCRCGATSSRFYPGCVGDESDLRDAWNKRDPALLAELAQLRELAKAAMEWGTAYQAFVDAHDGPDQNYHAAFFRQTDLRAKLDNLTRAYTARQSSGGTHV